PRQGHCSEETEQAAVNGHWIKQSRNENARKKISAATFADEIFFPAKGIAVKRRNWNRRKTNWLKQENNPT
ncbi:MAG: hypothetical protein NC420_13820, partial [Eubacterium sp.]|nr:hypothetical protein [Eubacterium sp.]MCM1217457.1 hypothetical protein [Lachnospiraceae bacterium]